ncbi:WG repeat-containing protein [uncultured Winogradskyella sp.]|uniref:WG repeat-containing protein n=1 Tax=uncultured Winogradskyella sp. TaxID=395353 RepID=UPI002608D4B9|nr:WG repeat-containing protein [uncultured Winogradskyella sp.]
MKKLAILCLALVIIPIFGFAQSIENLDFISPFHDDVAAIKKDGKWAFINKEAQLIIDYRTDLVLTENDDGHYPIFNNDRCQIVEIREGISYFGFIDKSGKTVIKPEFLNSTNFYNEVAIALKLDKQVIGKNTALDKNIVNYRYFEVLVNTDGEITYYLTQDGVNVVLDKDFFGGIPQITSRYLADNIYAVKRKNKTWAIVKIKDQV